MMMCTQQHENQTILKTKQDNTNDPSTRPQTFVVSYHSYDKLWLNLSLYLHISICLSNRYISMYISLCACISPHISTSFHIYLYIYISIYIYLSISLISISIYLYISLSLALSSIFSLYIFLNTTILYTKTTANREATLRGKCVYSYFC